jgi:predicted nucleic acid-binding protein
LARRRLATHQSCGKIRHAPSKGTPVSPNDLWIAASAAQHGLTVVTLNGDFDVIPQVLVRKFEPLNPVPPA